MAKAAQTRSIVDDDGAAHEYVITCHPAVEGLRLASALFGLAGPAMGKLLDGLKGAPTSAALLASDLDLGPLVRELAQSVVAADMAGLVRDLLRHSTRDGLLLSSEAALNNAFGGNYGEPAEAVAAVVEVNGFLRFFTRLAGQAGKALAPT